MTESLIGTIVQGGAVGISIALIYIVYRISAECSQNSRSMIEVIEKNASAMSHLTSAIDANTKATDSIKWSLENMADVARDAMSIKNKRAKERFKKL